MRPITLKIDVTKIDKNLLFKGQKGTYLDIVLFENKTASQYGDTHYCVQGVTKEDRERGVQGPIIGNATVPDGEAPRQQQRAPARQPQGRAPSRQQPQDPDLNPDDDIPF